MQIRGFYQPFTTIDHNKMAAIHYFDCMTWLRGQLYGWKPSIITRASSTLPQQKVGVEDRMDAIKKWLE
jgi:hypothetical protein